MVWAKDDDRRECNESECTPACRANNPVPSQAVSSGRAESTRNAKTALHAHFIGLMTTNPGLRDAKGVCLLAGIHVDHASDAGTTSCMAKQSSHSQSAASFLGEILLYTGT